MLNENLKLLTTKEVALISGGIYRPDQKVMHVQNAEIICKSCDPCPPQPRCPEILMYQPPRTHKDLTACDFFASLGITNTTVTITAGQKALTYNC
jgi:hypothetical protein